MYSDNGDIDMLAPKCVERNFEQEIERAGKHLAAKVAMKEAMENLKEVCGVQGCELSRNMFCTMYGDIALAVMQDEARISRLIREQEAYNKRNAKN